MGIKNLKKFLLQNAPDSVTEICIEKFRDTKIAIDLSIYFYRYKYNEDTKGKNFFLRGFFELYLELKEYNITPIFIFDGKPSEAKKEIIEQRKEIKKNKTDNIDIYYKEISELIKVPEDSLKENIEYYLTSLDDGIDEKVQNKIIELIIKIKNLKKNTINIKTDDYTLLYKMFDLMNIEYLNANEEADFLCSKLYLDGVTSCTASEDMDMLAHGSGILITGISELLFKKERKVVEYNLKKACEIMEITHEQFIDICILLSCDYCGTISGVGIKSILPLIKKHSIIEAIPKYKGIDNLDRARREFSKSKDEVYELPKKIKSVENLELILFLTENTNYKRTTILKKLGM